MAGRGNGGDLEGLPERRAALIVNAGSRQGEEAGEQARRLLTERGVVVETCDLVEDEASLLAAVDRALAAAVPLLVLGGGDGTMATVAGRLAHRETVLGVLPLGTTNNFARSLELPLDLEGAAEAIAGGVVAAVDLGRLDDGYFANVVSVGLNVAVAESVPDALKRIAGRVAYALAGAGALATHEPFHVIITSGDERFEADTHQLVVANGGFHSGRPVAEDARIDDHRLTIFALGDDGRLSALASSVGFSVGSRRSVEDDQYLRLEEARIETDPVRDVEADGEVRARTPLRVAVERDALQVMVQPDFMNAASAG